MSGIDLIIDNIISRDTLTIEFKVNQLKFYTQNLYYHKQEIKLKVANL